MKSILTFSIIIPTIGRASLARAVESALAQATAARYEIVVVNDSGVGLLARAWQGDPRVKLLETPRVERSHPRNAGAEHAAGEYLLFLDDDDWMLPNALASFEQEILSEPSAWLVGDCELLMRNGTRHAVIHPDLNGNCAVQTACGELVPLHALCVRRDLFFAVGGFAPITLGEDREFTMRLALHADVRRVEAVVGSVPYEQRSSTSVYTRTQTELFWQARDRVLDQPNAFARLRASAPDGYWRGRLMRLYLNSCVVNLKRKQALTAAVRAGNAGRALYTHHAIHEPRAFWRGVTRAHSTRLSV